jgi:glutamyl-tRNA reductase
MPLTISVVGVNHRTAPLEVRERFAHAPHEVPGALRRVVDAAGAGAGAVAGGAVLLSTCNRTEFYLSDAAAGATEAVWTLLAERLGDGRAAHGYGYVRRDREAVGHLYRVAAGLDSMILGESQIQGQVRDAWELARAVAGPVLHRLFQSALLVGARVRSETGLGRGAASAPSAAVSLAGKIFGDLRGRGAVILGAGEVAELAAACLVDSGVRVTLVANRTVERARAIAQRLGAVAQLLDEAWDHFATADIVITSTAAPRAVVTWARVAPAVARRGGRPLCILDLAVPRDVEPAVGQLENVFLYNIDDLQAVAGQASGVRRAEVPRAERIVAEEVEIFWAWHDALAVVPTLKEFRGQLDTVRAAELERALKQLKHLSPEDRARVERFSESLLNKFLHEPTLALKREAESGDGYLLVEALRRLFRLGRSE